MTRSMVPLYASKRSRKAWTSGVRCAAGAAVATSRTCCSPAALSSRSTSASARSSCTASMPRARRKPVR